MKSVIDVKNLSFRYKESQEYYDVKDITFHVKRGEWLSIVGHNGSGKSTLLSILSTYNKPSKGNVFIEDKNLNDLKSREIAKLIATVHQHNESHLQLPDYLNNLLANHQIHW